MKHAAFRIILFLSFILLSACRHPQPAVVSGVVRDDLGPVSGAVVRIQTTGYYTITDGQGKFHLEIPESIAIPFNLVGWAQGYYCAGPVQGSPGDENVLIQLHHHHDQDNPNYAWLPSEYHPGQDENQGCAACHSREGTHLEFTLPVDQWRLDAHSGSAANPCFLSMYNGTDLAGNQSPLTRVGVSRDYGTFPLPPDLSQPYYGPGYKLDFVSTNGNCATCHAPAAVLNDPYGVDPNTIEGVPAESIPCDFCHKVWDVNLNPATGIPYPNMPGVLSFEFRRPPEGHQFFAGPLDDVAPGEDTFSPVQTQSEYCAPCHFGVFWDTVIYNSFGEWLESPYSDPETGKTCQDCHMPRLGSTYFARPDQGGLQRDPSQIFSHQMPGALDKEFLQDALTMTSMVRRQADSIIVQVDITNDNTGHHIPTDSPLRHLILIVAAISADGTRYNLIEGPTLPDWTGVGDPAKGYFAGLPGKAYAKILEELWTGVSPTGAYWNPTRLISDNRIGALETATSSYVFSVPQPEPVTIEVTLLFRRAFRDLMDWKGWSLPDIEVAKNSMTVKE